MNQDLVKAVAGVAAGALLGWVGSGLTLTGRVSAIEAALVRIEARLYSGPAHPAGATVPPAHETPPKP